MYKKGRQAIFFLLLTVVWLFIMRMMTTPLDPSAIIQFEFIKTAQNALEFIEALEAKGQLELLRLSLYLDFIFPLLYGAALFSGTFWVCGNLPSKHRLNHPRLFASFS